MEIQIDNSKLIEILSKYPERPSECLEEIKSFIRIIAVETAIKHGKELIKCLE